MIRTWRKLTETELLKREWYATDLIERQAKEIERLKHDRDAAIADLYKAKSCNTCAKQYKDDCLLEECMEPCSAFAEGSVPYKWRGVEEEPHAD